jgi:hypothetical protein
LLLVGLLGRLKLLVAGHVAGQRGQLRGRGALSGWIGCRWQEEWCNWIYFKGTALCDCCAKPCQVSPGK